ncbi:PaaI family thioesterase [Antarcticimicrobium sediminis]|uniref:PaaI family thioesterase n=1 Tax=Antarcticimicrobium sediminis TaxID=2546227 RepID=A0A4R5F179_9RHOB|nr:PaaI family thioesterase [Antarcticimicrobium sediminis]TDE41194.1 PaaI family thioesterase [Antarcticimicrobium sediminis]
MTPETLQSILTENFAQWVRALDMTVQEADADHVLMRMPLGDHLARVGGIVSGQALAALADTTMVLAAVAHAGQFKPFATTDLHTQFLRPGTGSAILCQARIIRAGKALVFARAEMTGADDGKMVASATATFYAP